ncbi:MAG: DinB family protein [Saprospiraceae bacterium]|nr:DinB family protein [Saprospiraceae bacterium]
MKKNALSWQPCYFDRYIDLVPDVDLSAALRQSLDDLDTLDMASIRAIGLAVYAPGKWTLADLFQHLIDCERVFAYRAMRFARNDKTLLPGFDEDAFAANAGASRRSIDDLLAELRAVRLASILLFESFDEAALRRTGIAFNSELPVLALGFVLAGHQIHHFRVMEERYFPMLLTA